MLSIWTQRLRVSSFRIPKILYKSHLRRTGRFITPLCTTSSNTTKTVPTTTEINGIVDRVIFSSGSFTVLRIQVLQHRSEGDNIAKLSQGSYVVIQSKRASTGLSVFGVGDSIKVNGNWIVHNTYGLQLAVNQADHSKDGQLFQASMSNVAKQTNLINYISSGLFRGIGPVLAERIVHKFGEESLSILQDHDNRLNELITVRGISKNTIAKLRANWHRSSSQSHNKIAMFLQKHGMRLNLAQKLATAYKEDANLALSILSNDPYRLAIDIQGVGFSTSEKLAKTLGLISDTNETVYTTQTLQSMLAFSCLYGRQSFVPGALQSSQPKISSFNTDAIHSELNYSLSLMRTHQMRLRAATLEAVYASERDGNSCITYKELIRRCLRVLGVHPPPHTFSKISSLGDVWDTFITNPSNRKIFEWIQYIQSNPTNEIMKHNYRVWPVTLRVRALIACTDNAIAELVLAGEIKSEMYPSNSSFPAVLYDEKSSFEFFYFSKRSANIEQYLAKQIGILTQNSSQTDTKSNTNDTADDWSTFDPLVDKNKQDNDQHLRVTPMSHTRGAPMTLTDQQIEAVRKSAMESISIVTGGPGTGKTLTTRAIVELWVRMGLRIALACPTARAASKLNEVLRQPLAVPLLTPMVHVFPSDVQDILFQDNSSISNQAFPEATTLHRLLEYSSYSTTNQTQYPYGDSDIMTDQEHNRGIGFVRNMQHPLEYDAILIDEASMLDMDLTYALMQALSIKSSVPSIRLVLMGDADQLPPVGAGRVFADLLRSNVIPQTRLDTIFRQSASSSIVQNAHMINHGIIPPYLTTVSVQDNSNEYFIHPTSFQTSNTKKIPKLNNTENILHQPRVISNGVSDQQNVSSIKTNGVTDTMNKSFENGHNSSEEPTTPFAGTENKSYNELDMNNDSSNSKMVSKNPVISRTPTMSLNNTTISDLLQDCLFVPCEPDTITTEKLCNILVKLVNEYGYDPTKHLQVICPMRKGPFGTNAVNTALQTILNNVPKYDAGTIHGSAHKHEKEPNKHYGNKFNSMLRAICSLQLDTTRLGWLNSIQDLRIGDRVMQLKNNYEKGVINGDIGIVKDIRLIQNKKQPYTKSMKSVVIVVEFSDVSLASKSHNMQDPVQVSYTASEVRNELDLAYAVTVHKAQGSEWPVSIMFCHQTHFPMLSRGLLYTALSRARTLSIIVGSRKALEIAATNPRESERQTQLAYRLMSHSNPDMFEICAVSSNSTESIDWMDAKQNATNLSSSVHQQNQQADWNELGVGSVASLSDEEGTLVLPTEPPQTNTERSPSHNAHGTNYREASRFLHYPRHTSKDSPAFLWDALQLESDLLNIQSIQQ